MLTHDDNRSVARRHPALSLGLAISCLAGCNFGSDSGGSLPHQPNIVLLVLDAARVDHFGVYGYERDTTPNVDRFAGDATRFTAAIAEGSFTFPSIASLFVGLPPHRTGLLGPRRLGSDLSLLAEVARDAGYRTRGYSENPYVTPALGFDRGFEVFDTTVTHRDFRSDPVSFQHADSSRGIEAMLAFMSAEPSQPFFAYLHLLRPHNPYTPAAGYAGRFGSRRRGAEGSTERLLALDRHMLPLSRSRLDNLRTLYDENLATVDAMLGAVLDGMATRSVVDETIVIVLSDHGEAFFEHGRLLHASTTYDEMIRIPLLIRIPGEPAGVVDHPIQLAQLGKMLKQIVSGSRSPLDLLRAPAEHPDETISWATPQERRASVRTRSHKLIVDPTSLEVVGYYDLRNDPREMKSLPLDAEGSRLLSLLAERIAGNDALVTKPSPSALDPELLERVRALGYTEE